MPAGRSLGPTRSDPGGGNWLFANGSVRFLPYRANRFLRALATRAGGEVVTEED